MGFKDKMTEFGDKAKEHLPGILTGVGILGFVGTCVYSCFATLKAKAIIDENKNTNEKIKAESTNPESDLETTKQIKNNNIKTAFKVGGLYLLSLAGGIGSTITIVKSDSIQTRKVENAVAKSVALVEMVRIYKDKLEEKTGEDTTKLLEEAKKEEESTRDKREINRPLFDSYEFVWTESNMIDKGKMFYHYPPSRLLHLKTMLNDFNAQLQNEHYNYSQNLYNVLKSFGFDMNKFSFEERAELVNTGWLHYVNGKNPYGDNDIVIKFKDEQEGIDFVNGKRDDAVLIFNCNGRFAIDAFSPENNKKRSSYEIA